MPEDPELTELNRRLKPLMHELRPGRGPCPFVIDENGNRRVALSNYSAGPHATYVHVSRKWDGKLPLDDLTVTISYAPFVEGTAIIYDLVDETMQGKARPFVCDLNHRLVRVYMILPFQIETIFVQSADSAAKRQIEVAFLDARGETIQAALPFELRLIDDRGGELVKECFATGRLGKFSRPIESLCTATLPIGARLVVRSLLTGHDESLAL